MASVLCAGAPSSATAAKPKSANQIYAYDGDHQTRLPTDSQPDRGPLTTNHFLAAGTPGDLWATGSSARLSGSTSSNAITYVDLVALVQDASIAATTSGHVVAADGELSPLQRLRVAAKSLAGLSKAEVGVANSARGIYGSDAMSTLRSAAANGTSAEVRVGGTLIQYEPGLPASGRTMLGKNGFLLGPEAFATEHELAATIAHESYRLAMTRSAGGLSGETLL